MKLRCSCSAFGARARHSYCSVSRGAATMPGIFVHVALSVHFKRFCYFPRGPKIDGHLAVVMLWQVRVFEVLTSFRRVIA